MSKPGIRSRIAQKGTVIQFPQDARVRKPAVKDWASFDLGAVLITLIERCRHQTGSDITIRLSAGPGAGAAIAREEAAALDFAVGEIVSNAYRYSHPAGSPVEVTIECNANRDGEIVIDIGDDGVGLPDDFAEWRDAGNGMVSVRSRLQKIGAHVNVTSDDLGLRFQIILHPRQRRPTPARGNFVWL